MDLVEAMLKSEPLKLALIAIVLLALGLTPLGRKVGRTVDRALERKAAVNAASNPSMTGSGLILMIEDAKAPVPRHWVSYVDERIDHKVRNLVQSMNGHMEFTEKRLDQIKDVDAKLDGLQVAVARIEGALERRNRPR